MAEERRRRREFYPDRPALRSLREDRRPGETSVHEADAWRGRPQTRGDPGPREGRGAGPRWEGNPWNPGPGMPGGGENLFPGDVWAGEARRRKNSGAWAVLAAAALVLLGAMASAAYAFRQPYAAYRDRVAFMGRGTFFDGIFVDGVHVGGMDPQQAQLTLEAGADVREGPLSLSIVVDGAAWILTNAQIPFERNTGSVLEEAFAIGRKGFPWMIGSDRTPFETRFQHTQQTLASKAYFSTAVTYRKSDVRDVVVKIVSSVSRSPVNAVIASFDFNTKAFSISQDVKGAWLDGEDLFRRVTEALDRGDYAAVVTADTTPLLPAVTSVELQNSFAVLSSFTTETTSDEKRNNNVLLAARAVNGTTVMPGETFSFNKRVGERTAQKGYQMAPAIAGGVMSDEIGGGVCQVSSTLFNAAAMAGMTIVSRSPHAWPSSYVDMGRDATVNWPGLDFKFRNDKNTPVFLLASYGKRKLTVEVYGMMTGPGESIRLDTNLVSTTEPPREALFQQNPLLPPGTQKELKKPRTGYVVDTYRVYHRNGAEYRREKLFTSTYPAVQQVMEYN